MPHNTVQVSALSQVKWAINDQWEINTLGFAYIVRPTLWNLGLKHQMFQTEHAITSFNSHTFVFKSGRDLWLASLHGIVTSYALSDEHRMNLGLMDGLVMTFAPDTQTSLHLLTPLLGWDWRIRPKFAISGMFARPVFAVGQLESDVNGEGNLQIDFTRKNYNPGLGFITAQYAWERTQLEFGAIYVSVGQTGQIFPYVNFFWRFGRNG